MEARYSTYSSTQLAGEDRFVRWVLHGEHDYEWQSWITQQIEVRPTVDEASKIVLALSTNAPVDITAEDKTELWNRIHHSLDRGTVKEDKGRIVALWKWGLAAAAALTMVIWINNLTSRESIYAGFGERKEINLPEGSNVILNAGSSIAYKNSTFANERILHLDGEAFFTVKPGSTFAVKTSQGTVTVLGTSFNIYSRGDRFEVDCYTGKVQVQSTSDKEQQITAGQKTLLSKEGLSTISFSPADENPEWTSGKFSFENQPLPEVLGELERQFGINIKLAPGLETERYTGLFESGDLDKALELITWPLHLNAIKKGKTITISR